MHKVVIRPKKISSNISSFFTNDFIANINAIIKTKIAIKMYGTKIIPIFVFCYLYIS